MSCIVCLQRPVHNSSLFTLLDLTIPTHPCKATYANAALGVSCERKMRKSAKIFCDLGKKH